MPPRVSPRARDHDTFENLTRKRPNRLGGKPNHSKVRVARSAQKASQNGPRKRPKFSADPGLDVDSIDVESLPPPKLQNYIIGVDFGTTFSSISYYPYSTADEKAGVRPSDIKSIKNWPEDNLNNGKSEQVPMAIWYAPQPIQRDPIQGVQFDGDAKADIVGSQLRSVGFDHEAALKQLTPWKKDDDRLNDVYFGYQALWHRYNVRIERDVDFLVLGAKSELFKTPHSRSDRQKLQAQLRRLIDEGIIRKYGKKEEPDVRDVRDVITDLFVKLLQHTKQQLIRLHGFTNECPVEWELAIPTIWEPCLQMS